MLLAYDHGFEHGPADFDERSIDPAWIMDIADSGYFTGVIFQKGIASKYYNKKKHKVPLIVKLNGKTAFHVNEEPISLQNCTVDEAIELGAVAVGYTIYVGSENEQQMIAEFSNGWLRRPAKPRCSWLAAKKRKTRNWCSKPPRRL